MRIRKRSSCDSGSGKVPIWCAGFCVAMTKKGAGSGRVCPSTVTWRSSMASSRALCVFGVARLISSASTTWAKIGPGMEVEGAAVAVEDRDAEDVRRQHVAGELDALEVEAEQSGQHVRQRGLADAGQILDQQVAARQQAGQRQPQLAFLAEDDAAGGGHDVVHRTADRGRMAGRRME